MLTFGFLYFDTNTDADIITDVDWDAHVNRRLALGNTARWIRVYNDKKKSKMCTRVRSELNRIPLPQVADILSLLRMTPIV